MFRYKGILNAVIRVVIILVLVGVTVSLASEGISLPSQCKTILAYRHNIKEQKTIDATVNQYKQANSKFKSILASLKRLGNLSDADRNNFLGYIGKSLKSYNLTINSVEFVNINNYVADMETVKKDENGKEIEESDKDKCDSLIKQVMKESAETGLVSKESVVKISKDQQQTGKVVDDKKTKDKKSKNNTMNGILIDVSGSGEYISSFITDLEKFYYRYFFVSIYNDAKTSNLKVIIDLR